MKSALLIALIAMLLGGCATRDFSMRSLPPESPAADNAAAVKRAAAMVASKATEPAVLTPAPAADGAEPLAPLTTADAPSMYTYDPWERINRFDYRFNARFDELIFLPVADGYRRVPAVIRLGVHNFFGNLGEVPTVVNDGLQWQLRSGVRSLGRFVINSTIGIGGLIDVATKFHIEKAPATFGSTLSRWGVHPGPYVVLPLLGPSTLRESLGLLGDYGISYGVDVANLYRGNKTYALGVVDAIDTRSVTSFRYYATGSPFEYETIRFLYVRKALIEDEALHPKGRPKDPDANAPAGK
jgi:phospholipid-binding lipoprotein MlaA